MSVEKSFIPDQKQCPVCLTSYPRLYQISDCEHRFCEQCCISFINSQAENFSTAKCLQQGCNKPLDEKKQIYQKVPQRTQLKIKKHDLFLFLQKNPRYKQCSDQNCMGYFDNDQIHERTCNICHRIHCKKCFKLLHEGQCLIEDDAQIIGNLNYKKCPQCYVWIQKNEGCDYIDCKCGCKFCYKCGNKFERDPCRYGNVWKNNAQLRKILRSITIKKPHSPQEFICLLPKLFLQTILSVLFTMGFSLLILAVFLLLFCLTATFGPLALFALACQTQGAKRYVLIGLMIIFYPVMCGMFFFVMALLSILYPCLRNTYHHGLYDPYDTGLSKTSIIYIVVIESIWSW